MLKSLTSLRFFAALYVVLLHSGSALFRSENLPRPLEIFVGNGYLGVPFFFILSGFILQFTYRDRLTSSSAVGSYLVARFARVYPVYLASLLVASLVMPASSELLWPQFFLLQSWFDGSALSPANTNGVAWSLSVEAAFYLAFPIAGGVVARQNSGRLLVLLAVIATSLVVTDVAALTRSHDSVHTFLRSVPLPLLRLPEFLLGVALGELHLRGEGARLAVPLWAPALLLAAVLCTTEQTWVSGWVAVISGLLVLVAANPNEDWLARMLSHRLFVFLGASSYALYLLHVPIIVTLRDVMPRSVRLVLQLPILLGLAAAVFVLFEEPARRLIRRQNRRSG